jgi:hypothetical protein
MLFAHQSGHDCGWSRGDHVAGVAGDVGALRASHCSMSERSQPPEKCFRGNVPFRAQRNNVALWTPTTRRTSAVVIRWSRSATRSAVEDDLLIDGARRPGGGAEKLSDSCTGASASGRTRVSSTRALATMRYLSSALRSGAV